MKIVESVEWLQHYTNSKYGPFLEISENVVIDSQGDFWVNASYVVCLASCHIEEVVRLSEGTLEADECEGIHI